MHITDLAVCSAQSNPKYIAKSKKPPKNKLLLENKIITCVSWLTLFIFHSKTGVASAVKGVSYNLSDIISHSVKYENVQKISYFKYPEVTDISS